MLKVKSIKNYSEKIIFLSAIIFSLSVLGCSKKDNSQVQVQVEEKIESTEEPESPKESSDYVESEIERKIPRKSNLELLLEPTRNKMNRRKNNIPEELKNFYTYFGNHLVTAMKVNKADGLELYSEPNGKNIITYLPDGFNVSISALGEEVTRDGIKSAWVEVVKPRYTWKDSYIPEFGWVFGGYLESIDSDTVWHGWDSDGEKSNEFYLYGLPDFNSSTIYDLDEDGYSHANEYLKYNTEETTSDYYEKLIEFAASGVCGNDEPFHNILYRAYWHQVQKAREIYPVNCIERRNKIRFESLNEIASDFLRNSSPWGEYWVKDYEKDGKQYQFLLTQDMISESSIYSHYEFNAYVADDEGAKNVYHKITSSQMLFDPFFDLCSNEENKTIGIGNTLHTETGMLLDDWEIIELNPGKEEIKDSENSENKFEFKELEFPSLSSDFFQFTTQ